MDISSYISELLFGHDCVVIPNFGGFICNYRSADIHPVLNTISPPAKVISFNRNLQSNDGLLVSYIAKQKGVSFDTAGNLVNTWVLASKSLLNGGNDLILPKIGKLTNDVEGNLQFYPYEDINYLKASFGLKTITVIPLTRAKQIDFTEKFNYETRQVGKTRRVWSIAASVLLIISLVALAELMWMGVEIKPLHLNEAGIFGFLTRPVQPELKPVPVEIEKVAEPVVTETPVTEIAANDVPANEIPASEQPTYYIVVGAFLNEKNIETTRLQLQQKYPDSVILVEKTNRLTRLGYSVGHDEALAQQQLTAAKDSAPDYWLMKRP